MQRVQAGFADRPAGRYHRCGAGREDQPVVLEDLAVVGTDQLGERIQYRRPPAQPQVHRRLRSGKHDVGRLLVPGQHSLRAGGPVVGRLVAEYRQLAGEPEPAQFVGGRHAGRSGTDDDDPVPPGVGHRSAAMTMVVAARLSAMARAGHTRAAWTTCSTCPAGTVGR